MLSEAVSLYRGFFIIVLDLRLTKLVRGCRETSFNCFIGFLLSFYDFNKFNIKIQYRER